MLNASSATALEARSTRNLPTPSPKLKPVASHCLQHARHLHRCRIPVVAITNALDRSAPGAADAHIGVDHRDQGLHGISAGAPWPMRSAAPAWLPPSTFFTRQDLLLIK